MFLRLLGFPFRLIYHEKNNLIFLRRLEAKLRSQTQNYHEMNQIYNKNNHFAIDPPLTFIKGMFECEFLKSIG